MANERIVRIVIAGDATSGQKALKAIGDSATTAEVKVEGFGKKFLELGAAFGIGAVSVEAGVEAVKQLGEAVIEYNSKMEQSQATILGVTKDQGKLTAAFAFAESELKAGRAAYSDTVAAIAELTPTAKRTGNSVEDLYRTLQLLSTLNSGPGGGPEGALVAINNALAGQFTSLQERFNLPTASIQKAVAAGIPPLQAINEALAREGVTMDLVNAKAKTYENQMAIAKDQTTRLAAEVGKPIFTALADGLTKVNEKLTSGEWQQYAEQYQHFVKLLLESMTSWKSLSGVSEQVGIAIERSLQRQLGGLVQFSEQAGIVVGQLLGKTREQAVADQAKFNPLRQMLNAWISHTDADQSKLDQWFKDNFADPISDAATGNSPGGAAISPAKMQAAGAEIFANLVRGLDQGSSEAVDKIGAVFADLFKGTDGKADAGKLTEANIALAQALKETANGGQITSETMYALSAAYGLQTPLVYKLVEAYQAQAQAQTGIAAANTKVAAANAALIVVNAQATGETKQLEAALTSAQQAAAAHAQETADALEPLTSALAEMRAAAEAAGLQNSAAIAGLTKDLEGLQDQANANAADFQRQIATAQADYEQAQNRRQQLQGAMNAALHGEVEEWMRINEITDDSIRKIAEKWQEEIDGQRRAKEGADQAVTKLSREGNRDERDSLLKIQELRQQGKNKEANQEERALEKRRQQRAKEMEIARAQAAVAGDEYEEKAAQLEKEGKKVDETASKEEREAKKRVDEVTAEAAAQKAADDAAIKAKQDQIKAVQDAGRAEQERYAAQQRGIQAEIDKVNEAAKVQAAKDKKTIDDAQTILADRKTFWDQELAKAGENLTQRQNEATAAKNIADDSKTSYEWLERITKLDFQNVLDAAKAAKEMANQPPAPSPTQSGTPLAPAPQNTPGQTEGQIGPPGAAPGAGTSNLPPLYAGAPGAIPPPGYHSEVDNAGNFWFVADGYSLLNYGKQQGPGRTGQGNGDSTSMTSASTGAPNFLRAAGVGGGALAGATPAADGAWTIQIIAPNLRDLGNKQDQRDFAALMRRTWSEAKRGGLDPGKVDQG